MIQAHGLYKTFRRIEKRKDEKNKNAGRNVEFAAVDHIDIKADGGEILGILGPNGAGKTTLLRMLGCLMEPTDGTVEVFDKEGNAVTEKEDMKRRIGYLSGNTKLYHRFSCRELLLMMADIYGLSKEEAERRIEDICRILKMEKFIDNRIERLSTGQMQRANISRCLIHQPDIYIFDEPTLGLDIISSQSIIEFMKTEKENGKTILYSTHYMEEAQYLCDRIIMLNHGKIIAEGSPSDLMSSTDTNNLRDAFGIIIGDEEKEGVRYEQ